MGEGTIKYLDRVQRVVYIGYLGVLRVTQARMGVGGPNSALIHQISLYIVGWVLPFTPPPPPPVKHHHR